MRFDNPEVLQLVWLVIPFVLAAIWVWRRSQHKLEKAFGKKLTPFLSSSVSSKKRVWKLVLQTLAIILMLVAIARPQIGASQQEIKSRGVELVVAIDVSNSMMAEDVKPNRLEFAKKQVDRLLDRLAGDMVGLIAFAGNAVLISPLTNDYSALRMFVDSLSTGTVSSQGTVFKYVIQEALQAFKRGGVEDDENTRVSRVLIIVTDGEDQEPGAVKLAEESVKKGLRVFTLGVGTRKGAPIPVRDERGYLTDYKKDQSGSVIMSQANDSALTEIAKAGGGAFYHANFEGTDIESIKKDLDQLQKADFATKYQMSYTERYQVVLLTAFILALLEWMLGERRSPGRVWKGRFEVAES